MPKPQWVVVYAGGTSDTNLLCDLLTANGVTPRLADEMMGSLAPFVIAAGHSTAVKVLVPEDQLDDARDVVVEFAEAGPGGLAREAGSSWRCPHCGEECEANFDACWNCQTDRDTAEGHGPSPSTDSRGAGTDER